MNPKSLANLQHKGKPKGAKSSYTIGQLMNAITSVEKYLNTDVVMKCPHCKKKFTQKGKNISYLEAMVNRSLMSDSLAVAMLNRLVPVPKEPINLNTGPQTHITVIEKAPRKHQLFEIAQTLARSGVLNNLINNALSNNRNNTT